MYEPLRVRRKWGVALLAEGVDRNSTRLSVMMPPAVVALLAEGVDRNLDSLDKMIAACKSPSSRRAWIEISR